MRQQHIKLIVIATLMAALFLVPKGVAGNDEKAEKKPPIKLEGLKGNYLLDVTVNTEKAKQTSSLLVAGGNFKFSYYLPECIVSVDGDLSPNQDNGFLVNYQFTLKQKTLMGNSKKKGYAWFQDGCEGLVVLQLDKEVTIFKTDNRSYKFKLRKAE